MRIKIVVKWRVCKIDHISKLVRKIAVRKIDLVVYICKDLRPISLTAVLSRQFERIVGGIQ